MLRRLTGPAAVLTIAALLGTGACSAEGTAAAKTSSQRSTTPHAEAAAPAGRAEALRELRELEKNFQGRIGAFALDTGTGAVIAHREHERFGMASTHKAIVAAAILDKARRSDPGLLDRRVRWTREDLVSHSPVTEKHVDTGLTVAELCEAIVTVSDNTADNLLLKELGGPAALTRYFRSLGDPASRLDRFETELNDWRPGEKRDTTTPAFMGRDLAKIILGQALTAPDRERLTGWMRAGITGDKRIRAGLPEDWVVGDKTGTPGVYGGAHDIAVAWPPSGKPLVIVVYTNRRTADAAHDDSVVASAATILARGLGRLG